MKNSLLIGAGILVVALIAIGLTRGASQSPDVASEASGSETTMEHSTNDTTAAGAAEPAGESQVAGAGSLQVDPAASSIVWAGKKRVGAEHTGTVAFEGGTVELNDGVLSGGAFTVDMTSITNTDLEPGPMQDKLLAHFQSDDFFSVATHPTATLTITGVAVGTDGALTVTGDLTIKGITNEVTFPAEVVTDDGGVVLTAELEFDRSLYEVRFGSDKFFDNLGDGLVEDEVQLRVSVGARA